MCYSPKCKYNFCNLLPVLKTTQTTKNLFISKNHFYLLYIGYNWHGKTWTAQIAFTERRWEMGRGVRLVSDRAGVQSTLPPACSSALLAVWSTSSGPWGSEGAEGFPRFTCCILGTSGPAGDLEYLVLQHFGDINHSLEALSLFAFYMSAEVGVKSNLLNIFSNLLLSNTRTSVEETF